MTNHEKMNELVNDNAEKEKIIQWAYMNRITVGCLDLEDEFESMKKSVESFVNSDMYSDDETANWKKFLDCKYIN